MYEMFKNRIITYHFGSIKNAAALFFVSFLFHLFRNFFLKTKTRDFRRENL